MSERQRRYELTDHLCVNCGGRILQDVTPGIATGGGNPLFRCADCGHSGSGTGPQALCWCGFQPRGQLGVPPAYTCLPLSAAKENPRLVHAFLSCGCNPDSKKAEVGIVTWDALRRAEAPDA